MRQIKGILNKLTPEKFDRLLNQLLEVVTTAEILKHTIAMVFENAVAQPTFVAMYADLCLQLSKELPQFPPAAGEEKPMTFKRVLLNTCQDEFEETQNSRDVSGRPLFFFFFYPQNRGRGFLVRGWRKGHTGMG